MSSPNPAWSAAVPIKGRVLIVDDQPLILSYLSRTLRSEGHDIVSAGDGQAALAQLKANPCDLVISDLTMPQLDGLGFLRELRQSDPDLPVILITGNPDVASAQSAIEHRAFRYLTKPLRDTELHEVVQAALRTHQDAQLRRIHPSTPAANPPPRPKGQVTNADLDEALGTLWMAFQPIVRPADRTIYAHEALVRSRTASLPHPGALLSAAETLGRMQDLSRRIRELVAAKMDATPEGCFFVNLHGTDLLDAQLFDPESPLAKHAQRVVLEITERAALDEITDVKERVKQLRVLGYRIAVDDLGAGYAGLTSFARIEPDFVKFDISLIRDIHKEVIKQRLVSSLNSLCKDLNIQVVAEGVEVAEEKEALLSLGCGLLQGYLFARPSAELGLVSW
jgi:EAL domain-containing protein (putative c-di-GMP-specific phosphodiesterase class I)